MAKNQAVEDVMQVKKQYEEELRRLANVIGVGVGFKNTNGQETDTLAVVVNVKRKLPLTKLAPQDVVPLELNGVSTDVQEVGTIRAL